MPGGSAGEMAVIEFVELTVKPVALTVPKETPCVRLPMFPPVMVTAVPPLAAASAGDSEISVGGGTYVNTLVDSGGASPSGIVTVTCTRACLASGDASSGFAGDTAVIEPAGLTLKLAAGD